MRAAPLHQSFNQTLPPSLIKTNHTHYTQTYSADCQWPTGVMAAAVQLLFDQLSDLGDSLPAGVPNDEAGFCALVQDAPAPAAVRTDESSGGNPLLGALARALVRRVRAAEAAMEEEEGEEVSGV